MPNRAITPPSWGSLLAASASYIIWGLFPIYWRLLKQVDATELITHRVVWSLLFLLAVVAAQRRLGEFVGALRNAANLKVHAMSGALLTVNWLVYVWAANAGHVIECSLGYFLVPLLNVALGRWVLHERLRTAQALAIILAAFGVACMVWQVGRPPWIALALAGTFGFYGLLRKRSHLGPLTGLTVETVLLAPLALGYLAFGLVRRSSAFGSVDLSTTLLIMSTGVVTAVPLLLFAKGARGLRMMTLGLLQYLAPTGQFLLGWLFYAEPMSAGRTAAFALIWAGLALYSMDAVWSSRAPSARPSGATG